MLLSKRRFSISSEIVHFDEKIQIIGYLQKKRKKTCYKLQVVSLVKRVKQRIFSFFFRFKNNDDNVISSFWNVQRDQKNCFQNVRALERDVKMGQLVTCQNSDDTLPSALCITCTKLTYSLSSSSSPDLPICDANAKLKPFSSKGWDAGFYAFFGRLQNK